jgi:hypothetical protein
VTEEQKTLTEIVTAMREMLVLLVKTHTECSFLVNLLIKRDMITGTEAQDLLNEVEEKTKHLIQSRKSGQDSLLDMLQAFEGPVQ